MIIAKNTSILLITDVISKILLTILAIIIARKLGASDLGLLAYAISFSAMFSFIPNCGFKNFINREVVKYPDKSGSYFSNLAFIKLILSLVTFFIISTSSYIIRLGHEQFIIVCIAALIMVIDSFIQFYTAFFRGFQRAEYEALTLISQNFLVSVTGILIICMGYGLLNMMIVRLLVTLTIFFLGFIVLKIKILNPPFNLHLSSCRTLLESAKPFIVLAIFGVINAHIGIVLLTQLKGTLYTGWYSAALKLCGIFQFIPTSVAGAVLPAMTKFSKNGNKTNLKKTFSKSFKYLLILLLPIAAGTTILADKIILLIYNESFIHSILTLRILIWIVVLSFTNTIIRVAYLSIDKERKYVRIQFLGTIINISLCFLLIPTLGHNGVAIALTSSEFIIFIFSVSYISKYFIGSKVLSTGFKPIVATMIMVIMIFSVPYFNLFIIIPMAVLIYCLSLFMLKSFDDEDIAVFKTGIFKLLLVIRRN